MAKKVEATFCVLATLYLLMSFPISWYMNLYLTISISECFSYAPQIPAILASQPQVTSASAHEEFPMNS
jgi:hypothetical protein